MALDKPDIKMGFNLAIGFAAFGLVLMVLQIIYSKARSAV